MVQGPQDAYRRTLRLFHVVERDWPAGAHAFHPCIDSPQELVRFLPKAFGVKGNQASFSPFGPHEISVLIELPTWPNYVFCTDQLRKETGVNQQLT